MNQKYKALIAPQNDTRSLERRENMARGLEESNEHGKSNFLSPTRQWSVVVFSPEKFSSSSHFYRLYFIYAYRFTNMQIRVEMSFFSPIKFTNYTKRNSITKNLVSIHRLNTQKNKKIFCVYTSLNIIIWRECNGRRKVEEIFEKYSQIWDEKERQSDREGQQNE